MRRSTSSIFSGVSGTSAVNFLPSSLPDQAPEIYQIPALKSVKKDKKCVFVCSLTFLRCINCKVVCYTNLPPPPPVGPPFCLSSQPLRQDSEKKADNETRSTLCVYKSWNHWVTVIETRVLLPAAKEQPCCRPDLLSLTAAPVCVWTRGLLWFCVCDIYVVYACCVYAPALPVELEAFKACLCAPTHSRKREKSVFLLYPL